MIDNRKMSHPSSPPVALQLYNPLVSLIFRDSELKSDCNLYLNSIIQSFPDPLPFDPVQLNVIEHHQGQEPLPDDDSCLSEQQDEPLDV